MQKNRFDEFLEKTEEIGYVDQVRHSIAYVQGLPEVKLYELLIFESGELGQVISLNDELVEVLLLTNSNIVLGSRVTRTNEELKVGIGEELLGKTINALGFEDGSKAAVTGAKNSFPIDTRPPGIRERKNIHESMETGVTMVDLIVPIGKGQRELVVGDRKTQKTQFLLQAILTQAKRGTICVYAGIAKRSSDLILIKNLFENAKIIKNTVIVGSRADDPSGLIYLTPYTAMTIAEYFKGQGMNVLVVLDDLTAHAKVYREISLLAGRFPGRSSYPGDIFYLHSRLLERAGNFTVFQKDKSGKMMANEASITALPVAEIVMGDLSGYIQTNLMAMTDGHIFFDRDYYNQGRRPAINPFLSVTRVGRQAQTPLMRDINRQLTSFLVRLEDLRQFLHFGAELSEETRRTLTLGDKIIAFFEQSSDEIIPVNINILIISILWAGHWVKNEVNEVKNRMNELIKAYNENADYQKKVDAYVSSFNSFADIVNSVKTDNSIAGGS